MPATGWTSIGVDRAGDDWVAVAYTDTGRAEAAVFETIEELWTKHGDDADRIVVDVPIGLCDDRDAADPSCRKTDEELSRHCDDLARSVLGSRFPAVFTAPCRHAVEEAAEGSTYQKVKATNKQRTGKGLTQQAANIAPCIKEVDALLQTTAEQDVLVEGHPEVCFRAFTDGPLEHSKLSAAGVDERLTLLDSMPEYEQGTWRRLAEEIAADGDDVGLDDLLDALALAVTAADPTDEQQTLPSNPPTDSTGRPMQMVYRRAEPFDLEADA